MPQNDNENSLFMEILNNFGFEPILFLAQIVNFLIIYYLLKKLMFKPVLKMIEDRKSKITKGLKDAEEAEKKLEETTLREEKILKNTYEKARIIINEAKSETESILALTEENAKKKSDLILSETREQIAHETIQAEKKLELKISKLAVSFLESSLKGLFGTKEQEEIMKKALKKMEGKVN